MMSDENSKSLRKVLCSLRAGKHPPATSEGNLKSESRTFLRWRRDKATMKRRGKLLVLLFLMMGVGITAVLSRILLDAALPFPGAVVVLEDALWKSRTNNDATNPGYLWATPNTVLYTLAAPKGSYVVRQTVHPNTTSVPPQRLPLLLTDDQNIDSLSPDGKTLCVIERASDTSFWKYTLIPLEGKGKRVVIDHERAVLLWTPDSRSLSVMNLEDNHVLRRYDAHSGKKTAITLSATGYLSLTHIALDGRLLEFATQYIPSPVSSRAVQWTLSEFKGEKVVTLATHSHPRENDWDWADLRLSPTADRILWESIQEEESFLSQLQRFLFHTPRQKRRIKQWEVSDLNGKNVRRIGWEVYNPDLPPTNDRQPDWTPDGKGIHFLQDGKLMYLAVP
jgi:hypothetical protein